MKKTIPLLGPGLPALGMRSSQDAASLPTGIWSRLENVRCDDGTIRVRDASVNLGVEPIEEGHIRGLYSATFHGEATLFAAFRIDDATHAYRLVGNAWTEITTPETVFAADGEVGFAVVRSASGPDIDGFDILVFGNGVDTVRVWDGTNCAIQTQPPVPEAVKITAVPYSGMDYGDPNICIHASGSEFTGEDHATGTGIWLELTDATAIGDTVDIVFSDYLSLGERTSEPVSVSREIVLFAHPAFSGFGADINAFEFLGRFDILVSRSGAPLTITTATNASPIVVTTSVAHGCSIGDYVRVANVSGAAGSGMNGTWRISAVTSTTLTLEGSAGSGSYTSGGTVTRLEWITVYDPADPLTSPPIVVEVPPLSSLGKAVMAHVYSSGDAEGRNGWAGVRFHAASPPDTGQRGGSSLILIASPGILDSANQFAVSFRSSLSRAEGVAELAKSTGGTTVNYGLYGVPPLGSQYKWNPGSDFGTAFRVSFSVPAGMAGESDQALLYRSDPFLGNDGSTLFGPFYFVSSSDLPDSPTDTVSEIRTGTLDCSPTQEAPEVGHLTTPSGQHFATANDRLFVSGTSKPTDLWISSDRQPFRFRVVPQSDDNGNVLATSGTFRAFQGESVTGMLKIHGDLYGVDQLLVWTDKGLYRLQGFDSNGLSQAARLSEKGTFRAQTITSYGSAVWYLDTEGQVRRTNGGLASQSMSMQRVDDILRSGDLGEACSAAGFNAYRIWIREGESSLAMVWQETTNEWVLDRFPFDARRCVVHDVSPRRLILGVTDDGEVWEIERQGESLESDAKIPVVLHAREIGDNWSPITFGQMGLVMDGAVDTTLTSHRYLPYSGESVAGEFNLQDENLVTSQAWRKDLTSEGGVPGTRAAPACIPKVEGSLPGGKRIRCLNIGIESRTGGPDVA